MWICQLHQLQITLHNTCGNITWGFCSLFACVQGLHRVSQQHVVMCVHSVKVSILQECYNLTPAHLDMLRICYCTNSTSAVQVLSLESVSSYVQGSHLRIHANRHRLKPTWGNVLLFIYLHWSPPVFSSGSGHTSCVMVSCNNVCNVYDLLDVELKGLNRCHAWLQSAANRLCLLARYARSVDSRHVVQVWSAPCSTLIPLGNPAQVPQHDNQQNSDCLSNYHTSNFCVKCGTD